METLLSQLFGQTMPPDDENDPAAADATPAAAPPVDLDTFAAAAAKLQPQTDAAAPPAQGATPALAQLAPSMFTPGPTPPAPVPSALPPVTTYSGKGGVPTRQDVLSQAETGTDREAAAIDTEANVKGDRATYIADQKLKALQDQSDAANLINQSREQIRQQSQAKIDKVNAEIDRLSAEKPDTHQYFKNQGALATLAQLIGVGLSGYSQARHGGSNMALDLIEKEVDRNIQAQARDHQQRLATLQERRGAAKDEQASNLDALEFKVTRQVDANNRVGQMIDAAAARWGDKPEIQARAEQMKAKLQQNNAQLLEGIRSKSVSEAQEGARIGLQSQGLQLEKQKFEEQKSQFDITTLREINAAKATGDVAKVKALQDERERAVFAVQDPTTGKAVAAPKSEVAAELNKKIGAGDEAYNAVDKIFELRGTMGKDEPILGGPNQRRIEAEMGNLKTAVSKLTEQGVITTGDATRLEKELGNPTSLLKNPDQLRQLQGEIVDKVNNAVRAQTGARTATWRPDADPNFSQTVRPKGWRPTPAPLPVPSRGRRETPEQAQQGRAYNSQLLRETQPPGDVSASAFGGLLQQQQDEDPLATLAGGLYGR